MMSNVNAGIGKLVPVTLRLQDKSFRLTIDDLNKQAGTKATKQDSWPSPTLKFLSFRDGELTLLNTSEDRSHKLILQVQESRLFVRCSCSYDKQTICEHARAGLFVIIWHLGANYFEKLQPNGLMSMAFRYKKYFDKKESTAGIDISPRPEQKSIFFLAPKLEKIEIADILQFTATQVTEAQIVTTTTQETIIHSEDTLAYLLIISARNKLLPALVSCMGKLNKQRTEVKSFEGFLSGSQKQFSHLLTGNQKELNMTCYQLWKMIEKQPGHILLETPNKNLQQKLSAILIAWMKIIPLLKQEHFVYSYYLYGMRELRRRPEKRRIRKIILSSAVPEIRFVLKDKGDFYQLRMQVWVKDTLLDQPDTGTTLFIGHKQKLYMLSSIRDAAIAEWIHRSGGWITVFKEHFSQFTDTILTPLQQCYPVELPAMIKKKN